MESKENISVKERNASSPDHSMPGAVSLPPEPTDRDKTDGTDVASYCYQVNTDPVYEEFAVNPRRIASANQLLRNTRAAALSRPEPRKRLTSVSSSCYPEGSHDSKTVNVVVRPVTTDGNHREKQGSQVFWEDLVDLTEGNEPREVPECRGHKDAASDGTLPEIEPQGRVGPEGSREPGDSRPMPSTKKTKEASGAPSVELPKPTDKNVDSKKKSPAKRPPAIPPQPLVRFNSSGDFKAVVDDLYGKSDKRKINAKPTKWTNIRRMAMTTAPPGVKSQIRSQAGINIRSNVLTLKQREEKAIQLKEAAAHGWRVIRWYIEHQRLRKYSAGGALGWTVLKQHLNNMSDAGNARQDIYRRYGVIPTQQSDGSFKTVNVMRPKKCALKLVAFKAVKQRTTEKNVSKPPAFRQTLLK